MVVEKIQKKEHLTSEGLRQAHKAAINLGLSDVLKKAFPDISPTLCERSTGLSYKIPDPY